MTTFPVVFSRKFVLEIKEGLDFRVEPHPGEGTGLAGKLRGNLLEVVPVDVRVARGMDELARLQPADLCDHHREERVGRDVERYAQKDVGTTLIELAGELSVGDVELEQTVAGGQSHLIDLGGVPGGHQHPSGVRIPLNCVDDHRKLVDGPSIRSRPGTPLMPINRAQVAVLIGPFIPDGDTVVLEILHVRISGDEPQELIDDRLQMYLFCRKEGKAFRQVEPHLVTEHALRACAGAVLFHCPVRADMP